MSSDMDFHNGPAAQERLGLAEVGRLLPRWADRAATAELMSDSRLMAPPAALGTALATLSDHPWALTWQSCSSLEDFVFLWGVLSDRAPTGNRAVASAVGDKALVVVRTRRSGGPPHLTEDRYVLALLTGLLSRFLGAEATVEMLGEDANRRSWIVELSRPASSSTSGLSWVAGSQRAASVAASLRGDGRSSLAETADRLSMSPRTLQRVLHEEGTTFAALRSRHRLMLAAAHVAISGSSLTEAAYVAGFADSAHLSRVFRTQVGVSAHEWRRLTLSR